MSWESTALYYRLINEKTRDQLGGLHSAPIALVSVDFAPIEALQHADEWQQLADILCARARDVEAAGAELLLICTNTMHKLAEPVADAVSIPLLHIADATAAAIKAAGLKRVGLLGTRFTMDEDFYRGRLDAAGLDVLVPDSADRDLVHRVIFDELCQGQVTDASRQAYVEIIGRLEAQGAEGIIAGCTEIGMLIGENDIALPLFDTTEIHARQAVAAALAG